jgi:myo-inositol-1(or 4)-monophosphatase
MTDSPMQARFRFALDLIREAGGVAQGYFRKRGDLTIKSKGLQDMASEADLQTELLIKGRLQRDFPQDAFLGEETGITELGPDQGIWVVDPIDGTQPFISGMSCWCVSMAFVQGGELRFGMVYAPERGELFAGGQEFPATLNGQPVGHHPGRSIRVGIVGVGYSPRVKPAEFIAMFGPLLEGGGMFYREGSGALTLSYVAAGRLVGYIEPHVNSWDILGAMAVCRAAGLRTSDFLAGEGLRKGNHVLAGNAQVYAELEAIHRQALAARPGP